MLFLLDLTIGLGALVSAIFWWLASRQRLRRISRHEELNAADLNRIITVLNRAQILNARASIAASFAAALAALRMAVQAATDLE